MEIWNAVIMPAAPLLPPENMVGAVDALLQIMAHRLDLPELVQLIPYLMAQPGDTGSGGGGGEAGSARPPDTTRNYVRHNIPGGSRSQKENAMAQALLGSMPQPAEAAAIMR